jgi:small-conductance mechanosensitive channel
MPGLLLADIPQFVARLLNLQPGEFVRTILQIGVIWLVIWIAHMVIRVVAHRIERAVDDGDDTTLTAEEKRGYTIAQLLRSVGGVILLVIGGLLTLDIFINIGPLLAGAGIAGLAISFGAQSLVRDLITGAFILMENQFGLGDVIEAGGKTGVVEGMTLRTVTLRDVRGVVHIIPNGQITTVSNLTRGWARAVVEIGVAYGTEVDRALAVFRDEAAALAADPAWRYRFDGEPEVVGVDALADSAVVIRTHLRTVAGSQWAVAREFRRRIKNRLDHEGIEIPFPQRTVHLRRDT